MFTGIIRQIGEVREVVRDGGGVRLRIALEGELPVGESVAVNGVCLTVTEGSGGVYTFFVVPETVQATTLGEARVGERVHIELPLRLSDFISGHVVSGHVDGVGEILRLAREGEGWRMRVRVPPSVARVTVPKGSITLHGVSLTVAKIEGDEVEVALIPHTWEVTVFREALVGGRVHCEADMLGKFAERLLVPYADGR